MTGFPLSMKELVKHFSQMPGIGSKSAERLAFYILRSPRSIAESFAQSILKVKSSVRFCKTCNNLSDAETCDICSTLSRDRSLLCIVEDPNDINTVEKAGGYRGLYHVLLGSLSPLDGIGPQDLKIQELLDRVRNEKFEEIIIATDFNTEGEATALYLLKVLKNCGARLTRVAYGIPVGGNLEYADQATIVKAFEGRISIKEK